SSRLPHSQQPLGKERVERFVQRPDHLAIGDRALGSHVQARVAPEAGADTEPIRGFLALAGPSAANVAVNRCLGAAVAIGMPAESAWLALGALADGRR